jgi:hypothetical protein
MIARQSLPLLLSIGVAVAGIGVPVPARANRSKQQCVDDNEKAQELRGQGHFAAASARLERCAIESCPAIVRDDCARRLNALGGAQPSLVFEVRAPSGMDISSVRVSVDGQLLTDHLDGTPLKIDPGPHAFTFAVPGHPEVTQRLVVREGEALRHERVVIGVLPTTPPDAPIGPADQSRGRSTRQLIGLSAAGVGMAGVVVGTVVGLMARSAWTAARDACGGDPSQCLDAPRANSHRSQSLSDGSVSTVAFLAGGALIAGGALLYLTGGESPAKRPEGLVLGATVDSGRTGIVLRGVF